MHVPPETAWIIHDGAAGNRRQAHALAAALALDASEWSLQARGPARWFAPRRLPGSHRAFGPAFAAALAGAMPDWVIGCGRQAALATRLARERGVRAIQILDPRINPRHWDLVIAPQHDGLQGGNVLTLTGSLNPVDANWLAAARAQFPALGALPGPRTAVLLGGPTTATHFDRGALEEMMAALDATLADQGGGLLLCGSRRTPPEFAARVRERCRDKAVLAWFDDRDGANFFPGALAWADRIVVSPDSVNLVSEACATEVPVFVAEPGRATGRVRRFLAGLEASGRIRAQDRELAAFASTPLRETARIAAQVRAHFSPR